MDKSEVAVSCSFGAHLFGAGDVVSALLRAGGAIPTGKLYTQVYGHIFVDQKWLKMDYASSFTKLTSIELVDALDSPPRQHSVNNLVPHCVYLTPKEEVNSSILSSEGILLQFQLPKDVFPTCHGMACSISYSIALFWGKDETTTAVYFPFRVSGIGSSSNRQLIRYNLYI
jgi:hypothetical protein